MNLCIFSDAPADFHNGSGIFQAMDPALGSSILHIVDKSLYFHRHIVACNRETQIGHGSVIEDDPILLYPVKHRDLYSAQFSGDDVCPFFIAVNGALHQDVYKRQK